MGDSDDSDRFVEWHNLLVKMDLRVLRLGHSGLGVLSQSVVANEYRN